MLRGTLTQGFNVRLIQGWTTRVELRQRMGSDSNARRWGFRCRSSLRSGKGKALDAWDRIARKSDRVCGRKGHSSYRVQPRTKTVQITIPLTPIITPPPTLLAVSPRDTR